jgi:hypothetical protein
MIIPHIYKALNMQYKFDLDSYYIYIPIIETHEYQLSLLVCYLFIRAMFIWWYVKDNLIYMHAHAFYTITTVISIDNYRLYNAAQV